MGTNRHGRIAATGAALVVALSAGPTQTAWASGPADEQDSARAQIGRGGNPDFRFGPPAGWFGVRASKLFVRADGELFEFVRDELTIDRRDFDTPAISFEVGAPVAPRVDAVFDVGFSRASIGSEFRDFVDEFDLPIVQTTRLTEVPVGASIRVLLLPRGREIGRYAWVASDFTPYVGAGVGGLWYRFEQEGDFVDFVDLAVFRDRFQSSGWGLSSHVFGGASVKLNRWVALAMEARYMWSSVQLGPDFIGFDQLDLAGFKVTTGLDFSF